MPSLSIKEQRCANNQKECRPQILLQSEKPRALPSSVRIRPAGNISSQQYVPATKLRIATSQCRIVLASNREPSAPLIAGGDLVLVGGEGCQDFGLLALRYLEDVQGPFKLCCDLIEF